MVRVAELWLPELTASRLAVLSQGSGAPLTFVVRHLVGHLLASEGGKRWLMRERYGERMRAAWEQREREG